MYYQTVSLEHDCEVDLVCDMEIDEEGRHISNVRFAEDYIQLFGVEIEIKSLRSDLVKAILNTAEEAADDMEWEV